MPQQTINTGTVADDHTGDNLRAAYTKTNANFTEVYGYDIGLSVIGKPTSAEVVSLFACPRAVTFTSAMTNSIAKAGTAATGSSTFTLAKNGTSVGTIVFAASGTTGTFTGFSAWSLASGDVLKLTAPSSQDATLADITITLAGLR